MRPMFLLLPLAISLSSSALAAEPVAVSGFDAVELRGGGAVTYSYGAAQRVTLVAGSSAYTRFRVDSRRKLIIDACNGSCPKHYNLQVRVELPKLVPSAVEGGGTITAEPGFAAQSEGAVAVDGGGVIDFRSVRIADLAASVNGGGKIMVGPSDHLAASVSGGGEIRYAGNPDVVTSINGGGRVRPAE